MGRRVENSRSHVHAQPIHSHWRQTVSTLLPICLARPAREHTEVGRDVGRFCLPVDGDTRDGLIAEITGKVTGPCRRMRCWIVRNFEYVACRGAGGCRIRVVTRVRDEGMVRIRGIDVDAAHEPLRL